LISCRLVWESEIEVKNHLAEFGVIADVPRFDGQQLEEDDLLPVLSKYDGILAGDDHLTRRVLESAPNLRVISKWGIGIDGIDLAAAEELGIAVKNTPGVFGDELADYAMGYLHMLARRQHEVNEKVKLGEWHKVRGTSLPGKTLGIIGLGSSGRLLARRGTASGMKVIGYDIAPVVDDVDFETRPLGELLAESDAISLHVPATTQTRHIIDRDSIQLMRPGVWIINTSRGALVDESALADALDSGAVGAAALDVFETEPVDSSNRLLRHKQVIAGSHNGSNTNEAVARTTDRAIENLIEGLGLETSR
jgi:D-3-phosphoglycerate dehydrogenase